MMSTMTNNNNNNNDGDDYDADDDDNNNDHHLRNIRMQSVSPKVSPTHYEKLPILIKF